MIGKRITKLARAISEYEGWSPYATASSGARPGSVSYRNHNPGNLRSSPFQAGERDGFAVFFDDHVGFMALCYDLWIKASGRSQTGLQASDTIARLFEVYAPPVENDTKAYTDFIVARTGYASEMTLADLLTE